MTNSKTLLPPHVTLLGQALTPLLHRLEGRLADGTTAAKPGSGLADFADLAQETLSRFHESLERLVGEANRLGGLVSASAASDAEVHRTAGRIEIVLDDLLGRYAALGQLQPEGVYAEGYELLLAALRRFLADIRDWLREVVDAIADPIAAVKKHGLPESGQVNLHLILTLEAPPELEAFNRWLEEQEGQLAGYEPEPPRERSTWNGLVALVAGFALGGLFFGGDDE